MTNDQKVANIIAFFAIIFSEEDEAWEHVIMKMSPSYLIEKFERYVESEIPEYNWGMHLALKKSYFDRYVDKWQLGLKDA